ncbi:hypothetical protein [Aliivibrio fischeri]|uniref:hypothetical protein n=1 Tax=Aliivibrio fischeri TaxID=668 RepID=UPI0007C4B057|nr:hypothetical protein [Aliivibrio fischeri]
MSINDHKVKSFIAGAIGTCAAFFAFLESTDYEIIDKNTITYNNDLDSNYIDKNIVDKLYLSKEDVADKYIRKSEVKKQYIFKEDVLSKYTKNEDVDIKLKDFYKKEYVEDNFVSKDRFYKLNAKYMKLDTLINNIPTPFNPLEINLQHVDNWYDSRLEAAIQITGWGKSEGSAANLRFTIKLPNMKQSDISLRGDEYKTFVNRFYVSNRTFEIRLVNIDTRLFRIEEIKKI